ncbi:MAG TPA: hypothetical protein VH682_26330, partial [Gemmataceae bacterium]
NVDPKDYACATSDEVRSWFACRALAAGDVVLMHDNHPHAAAVVSDLVATIRRQGLTLSSLADWIRPHAARTGSPRADQALWDSVPVASPND